MKIDQYQILFQLLHRNKFKDRDAFDLQNIKRVGQFFFNFDSFYSLVLVDNFSFLFIIRRYIWQCSEIYSSYSPTFAMKICAQYHFNCNSNPPVVETINTASEH